MGCEVLSVLLCWGLGWRWKTEIVLLKSTPVPPPRRKGPGQLCHAPSLVALLLSHLMLELVEIWSDATPKSFLRWHRGWLAPWGVPFPLGPLGSSSQPRSLCPPALFHLPVPCPGLGEGRGAEGHSYLAPCLQPAPARSLPSGHGGRCLIYSRHPCALCCASRPRSLQRGAALAGMGWGLVGISGPTPRPCLGLPRASQPA